MTPEQERKLRQPIGQTILNAVFDELCGSPAEAWTDHDDKFRSALIVLTERITGLRCGAREGDPGRSVYGYVSLAVKHLEEEGLVEVERSTHQNSRQANRVLRVELVP